MNILRISDNKQRLVRNLLVGSNIHSPFSVMELINLIAVLTFIYFQEKPTHYNPPKISKRSPISLKETGEP
jgi:hypothetical protein